VAGIIGALGNNGAGVAGLSWAVRLMPIKITDRNGDASIAAAADGIRWATEYGAKIINLSAGGLEDSQTVRRAVADARSRGVLLVAAAGNCGEVASFRDEGCDTLNAPFFPAALPDVVAVGALGANDEVAPYSNTGEYVRLTAPGGVGGSNRGNPLDYILSTWPRPWTRRSASQATTTRWALRWRPRTSRASSPPSSPCGRSSSGSPSASSRYSSRPRPTSAAKGTSRASASLT
jgi:subtilisin family serine protease